MKDTLISCLRNSGEILLTHFSMPLKIRHKESQSSIVTEADLASEKLIIDRIRKEFPDHNILSEERGFIHNNSPWTWIIDPLDGTSNFASGIPWFGVLITVFENNLPKMAGAYLPVQDILYFTESGNGAFRNGEQMPLLAEKKMKESLVAFCVDYTEDVPFLNMGIQIYKYLVVNARNIRSTNSLIDFLYVAEGKFGGVINLYTKVWDISAPGLIISELGGKMTDIDGGDVKYRIGEGLISENFPVIAGTEDIIRPLGKFIASINKHDNLKW